MFMNNIFTEVTTQWGKELCRQWRTKSYRLCYYEY